MATFKIGDREIEIRAPRGRQGRKATNFLIMELGRGSDVDVTSIIKLLDSEEFDQKYLPVLLNVEPKFLDEEGTSGEILNGLMKVVEEVFKGFAEPEVEAALGN